MKVAELFMFWVVEGAGSELETCRVDVWIDGLVMGLVCSVRCTICSLLTVCLACFLALLQLNISYPVTGCQKLIEVEDEKKLRGFYDKRMSHEVDGDILGDDYKGYVFKISGGNDKQGFPMKQGVLTNQRVRLLLSKGEYDYQRQLWLRC